MRRWSVDPWILLWAAFLLLTLPLDWLAAFLFAAAVHEMCHITAIRLSGGDIMGLQLSVCGAVIQAEGLSRGKELFCTLAGPAGGLCLVLLHRWMPRTAMCALVHTAYNLLPVYPLDGGRALRCAAYLCFGRYAQKVCAWVELAVLAGLLGVGFVFAFFAHLGGFPLLLALYLIIKVMERKKCCKVFHLGVQ